MATETKAIQFPYRDLTIFNALTVDDFKKTETGSSAKPGVFSAGYETYSLPPLPCRGKTLGGSITFHQGKVERLFLVCLDDEYGKDWSEWSEALERKRFEDTLRIMKEEFGLEAGSYADGKIWGALDTRAGEGHVVVQYSPQP